MRGSWSATGADGHSYYGGPDYWHGGYYGACQLPGRQPSTPTAPTATIGGGWNTGAPWQPA